jgi:hypothetical protein
MSNRKPAILFFFLLFVSLFVIGCKKENQRNRLAQIIQEWQGKEILFPSNIIFTLHGRDTLTYKIPASPHKIVVYVDSVGCTACDFSFSEWKKFVDEVGRATFGSVPVLFFFHAKNPIEISRSLRIYNIDTPVVFDLNDELNTLNRFPSNQDFQTFLLDENNRVVFIGNPVNNRSIRNLYLSEITDGNHQSAVQSAPGTQIEVGKAEFDLDTIPQGEAKVITVSIKNNGNKHDSPIAISLKGIVE